jgi:hypothetical protein
MGDWRGPWARKEKRPLVVHSWMLVAATEARWRVLSRVFVQSRPGSLHVLVPNLCPAKTACLIPL